MWQREGRWGEGGEGEGVGKVWRCKKLRQKIHVIKRMHVSYHIEWNFDSRNIYQSVGLWSTVTEEDAKETERMSFPEAVTKGKMVVDHCSFNVSKISCQTSWLWDWQWSTRPSLGIAMHPLAWNSTFLQKIFCGLGNSTFLQKIFCGLGQRSRDVMPNYANKVERM